jgi:phosphoenolpyruvate---glycerone phosphotransferase subunit DhaL
VTKYNRLYTGKTMNELTLHQVRWWMEAAAALIEENKALLTDLDTAIGDGDHGTNMSRGLAAVRKRLDTTAAVDVGGMLKLVGMTLLSTVGGAAGPLYGGFFLAMAKTAAGKATLARTEMGEALTAGLDDIRRRGKAEVGDKTMVDALTPAVEAFLSVSAEDLRAASRAAADAARVGAEGTTPLQARKGRASYLGERSIGHQDPGATSSWLLLEALASACRAGGER